MVQNHRDQETSIISDIEWNEDDVRENIIWYPLRRLAVTYN